MSAIVEPVVKMPDSLQKNEKSSKDPFNRRPLPIFNKRQKGDDSKNTRPYCRKRSYRGSDKHAAAYKRRKKEQSIAPSRFLLGGNIRDPLNLNSLQDEEVNRRLNAVTPETSPMPTPQWKKGEVEVLLPPNIHDPLNLEADSLREDRENLAALPPRAKKRPKRKRQRLSSESAKSEDGKTDESLSGDAVSQTEPPTSGPAKESTPEPKNKKAPRRSQDEVTIKPPNSLEGCKKKQQRKKEVDKIVSPVVPQPGAWPRRKAGHPPIRPPAVPAQKIPSFKEHNRRFQYGNYNRYYGYRAKEGDPRLAVLSQRLDLFAGREVLDIGCNVGHVTLAVASTLGPKRVVGVDLDKRLIDSAKANIRHYVRQQNCPSDVSSNEFVDDGSWSDDYESGDTEPDSSEDCMGPSPSKSKIATNIPRANVGQTSCQLSNSAEKSVKSVAEAQTPSSQTVIKAVLGSQENAKTSEESEPVKEGTKDNELKCLKQESDDQSEGNAMETSQASELVKKSEEESNLGFVDDHSKPTEELTNLRLDAEGLGDKPAEVLPSNNVNPGCSSTSSQLILPDPSHTFPQNVSFIQGNYILGNDSYVTLEKPQFDTILCLSVTKWFHLNWGDDGLKRAFRRMFAQLKPGGALILEPQPWQSYKKKKNITETTWKNYQNIQLFPHKFTQFLLSEVGFSKCEVLGHPSHNSKGFQRPIRIYTKGFDPPKEVSSVASVEPAMDVSETQVAGDQPLTTNIEPSAAVSDPQVDTSRSSATSVEHTMDVVDPQVDTSRSSISVEPVLNVSNTDTLIPSIDPAIDVSGLQVDDSRLLQSVKPALDVAESQDDANSRQLKRSKLSKETDVGSTKKTDYDVDRIKICESSSDPVSGTSNGSTNSVDSQSVCRSSEVVSTHLETTDKAYNSDEEPPPKVCRTG